MLSPCRVLLRTPQQPAHGFSPSQLIQDAQRHQITVLPVDINHSVWDHEPAFGDTVSSRQFVWVSPGSTTQSTRLWVSFITALTGVQPPGSSYANWRASALMSWSTGKCRCTVNIFRSSISGTLANSRTRAGTSPAQNLDQDEISRACAPTYIPTPTEAQSMQEDFYAKDYPLPGTPWPCFANSKPGERLAGPMPHHRSTGYLRIKSGFRRWNRDGQTTTRLRIGVTFVTLEDDSVIVTWWSGWQQHGRKALIRSKLLQVAGILEKEEGVIHLIAGRLTDRTAPPCTLWGGDLRLKSRDFH